MSAIDQDKKQKKLSLIYRPWNVEEHGGQCIKNETKRITANLPFVVPPCSFSGNSNWILAGCWMTDGALPSIAQHLFFLVPQPINSTNFWFYYPKISFSACKYVTRICSLSFFLNFLVSLIFAPPPPTYFFFTSSKATSKMWKAFIENIWRVQK